MVTSRSLFSVLVYGSGLGEGVTTALVFSLDAFTNLYSFLSARRALCVASAVPES